MQPSLFSFALNNTKPVRKEAFLKTMDKVMPWKRLCQQIESKLPSSTNHQGRKALSIETKLRCLFLQLWYGLSDIGIEDDINDRASFQRFLNMDSCSEVAPDSTTICKFRDFLHKQGLSKALFEDVNSLLSDKGLTLKSGTAVDASIISAPSSTKNKQRKRDVEMSSKKKGANYYFGMKVHTGVDVGTGIVHSLECTTAKVNDGSVFESLLHKEEGYVTGDRAYDIKENVRIVRKLGAKCGIIKKKPKKKNLRGSLKKRNKMNSSKRSWAEFPFNPVKRIWKQSKVRFKGLEKNRSWFYLCFALSNIYMVRNKLSHCI